jgi:hypothetical protein
MFQQAFHVVASVARIGCLICLIGLAAASASAQVPGTSEPPQTGFQFEVHGGSASAGALTLVGSQLAPAGSNFPDFRGGQSRFVPSWFFGDGALLANQVAGQTGDNVRIVALDPVLTAEGANRAKGGAFGFRIGHTITRHVLVEVGYDKDAGHLTIDPAAKAAINATAASFAPYWTAVLTRPSTANVQTSASAAISDNVGTTRFFTFDVAINIVTIHRWTPYIEFGGGLALPTDDEATVALTGNYQLNIVNNAPNNGAPLNETDRVRVRFQAQPAIMKIFGGGVEGHLMRHLGVRVDIRGLLGGNDIKTRLDTAPQSVAGTKPAVVARGASPSLQISTFAGTPSSLVQQGLSKVDTFEGTTRFTTFSAGVFFRF